MATEVLGRVKGSDLEELQYLYSKDTAYNNANEQSNDLETAKKAAEARNSYLNYFSFLLENAGVDYDLPNINIDIHTGQIVSEDY